MALAKPVFSKAVVQKAESTEWSGEWVERNTGRFLQEISLELAEERLGGVV